ncbi:phosphatidylinositol-binding protein scs2, partial [Mortierella sp. NVP85]
MSIELNPSVQLTFRRPLTEAIKETLIIYNPTQLPVAFKVKTTAPKQYCVRPNSGRIEPGQKLEVQIQMQAMKEEPAADFKCKDKFLVQSVAITAEREQLPAAELWPAIERDAKDQVIEKKIRCVFLPPVERAVPQASEGGIDFTVSSVEFVEEDDPESPSTHQPARSSHDSESSSADDLHALKRELESAQGTIRTLRETLDKVQNEANV